MDLWVSASYSYVHSSQTSASEGLGGKLDDELIAMQKILDNALSKLPKSKYNDGILKRSAYFSEQDIKRLFKEGGDFKDQGFFSTTYSDEALNEWLIDNLTHSVIFKVKGKNAKLVEEASMLPHEAELLFKSGTEFDVDKVFKDRHPVFPNKDVTIIELIEK